MNRISEAVRAYLQSETNVRAVCEGSRYPNEYPLIVVNVTEGGTVLTSGGRLCEHDYGVSIRYALNRERTGETAALAALVPVLLRGVPMSITEGGRTVRRVLSPQGIKTEGDELSFRIRLSMAVPPKSSSGEATDKMQELHLST